MADAATGERNKAGEWRPAQPIKLAPVNDWPPQPAKLAKWAFGFPGFLWPYNAFWLAVTLITWMWLTPDLAAMQTVELWWVAVLLVRNMALLLALFGGLHLYFYIMRGQKDEFRFTLKPFIKGARHFLFRNQVRDNMLRTLAVAVPIITAYEVATYWLFANGFLGLFDLGESSVLFWGWFAVMILAAPFIHSVHFYLGHRLLHVRWFYRNFHALHHRNVEVGPWSGLAMHPVEHIIYFSTIVVPWLLALHPVNALYQLQLAAFLPALSHSGYDRLKVGKSLEIDAGAHFHYLHHKYFECNYGGSLLPLDKMFGTFHDGSDAGHASLRQRIRERRKAMAA
jgi:sterol desaturase/sphingolipid hydroxylase (fatty acid hydroxylase superfamily)